MSTAQFNINIPHKPHNYGVCGIFYFYYYMKTKTNMERICGTALQIVGGKCFWTSVHFCFCCVNPIPTPFEQVLIDSVLKKLCFKGNGTSLRI